MDRIMNFNFTGLITAVATFLIIGLFHPIVIKAEYYWGVKCWWLFLVLGLATLAVSVVVTDLVISVILGVLGITFLWSIIEIFEQRERVRKGWFPKNPNRKD
ncbi:MAG: DUF4491 family protein [Rikenellaceae bacterium]